MTVESEEAGSIGKKLVAQMEQITMDRFGDLWLKNAQFNQKYLDRGKSLLALKNFHMGEGDHAIVIAAGPSLKRKKVAQKLQSYPYNGAIIIPESALFYCLRHGIVPNLVVTVDPDRGRTGRWYGDPNLNEKDLEKDDYFRRQEQDVDFKHELQTNQHLLELMDQYGKGIPIALSTSSPPSVVKRVLEIGMDIYWWNPMIDDPEKENSLTLQLHNSNKLPCVNSGGNVGTACWMMAHAVLGKRRVALTGLDFSYYDDNPYTLTQYYHGIVELVGEENLDKVFMRVFNPHVNRWFYADPAYMWFRDCFLEMAKDSDCITYNCTEGGILFGEPIEIISLKHFLIHVCKSKN